MIRIKETKITKYVICTNSNSPNFKYNKIYHVVDFGYDAYKIIINCNNKRMWVPCRFLRPLNKLEEKLYETKLRMGK